MKKIIVFAIIIFTIFEKSFGQPPMGSVNYDPSLDKFVGTWKWTNGASDELILKLKKVMYHSNGINHKGYYEEILQAGWKYTKNGVVIEDNLSIFTLLGPDRIEAPILSSLNQNKVRGLLKDALRNKYEYISLAYDGTTTIPSLELRLTNYFSRSRMVGQPAADTTTTLPRNLTLIKQP